MLDEFVNLKAGDVVVQNGANSAVGQVRRCSLALGKPLSMLLTWCYGETHIHQYLQILLQLVIQLAKPRGIHTVNVVRDRPDMGELEHILKGLGADVVTTDDKLKSALGD